MRRKIGVSLLVAVIMSIMAFASIFNKSVRAAGSCVYEGFEATVLQGTNKGLTLQGPLELSADEDGRLTGLLNVHGGRPMHVAGQVNGSLIGLIFDARAAEGDPLTFVYGTGVIIGEFSECNPDIGGTLTGPAVDDLGSWSNACSPVTTDGPRPGLPRTVPIICQPPPPPTPNPVPPLQSPFLNN